MKPTRQIVFIWALLAITILGVGCGRKEDDSQHKEESGQGHDEKKSGGKEEEHEESPSGASFKPGKGIILTDETRKILNVETADVTEEKLPQVIRFNVQIFTQTHRFVNPEEYHSGCDIHGSGSLSPDQMAIVEPKQPVKVVTASKETLDGFVVAVQKTPAHGESEVIIGITSAGANVKDGEFVTAAVTLPREEVVAVIPSSALLKTAEGTFVYAMNGAAYYRTAVKTGSESDGKIEIIDGLFAGDQVVTSPVETLWLIELRATKGGGHSH
jgi:hypothetical protein